MTKFVYQVKESEFVDTEAFGEAWAQAKKKAAELHCPIFRLVIKGEKIRQEVYYNGGLFNSVKFMREDNVKVF